MLDTLYKGFKSAREKLSGKATLDEGNIRDALRDVRTSLLEADVEFNVVKRFLARVEEKALGELVTTRVKHKGGKQEITPAEVFINICHDELVALMGPVDTSISFKTGTGITIIMMVGLQGAGKTTTVGKLAKKLQGEGYKPLLVAADIYRPAAIDQLQILGRQLGVPVFTKPDTSPPALAALAIREARFERNDVVIIDTAGRLTIDEFLMNELVQIRDAVRPDNTFLVLDAMTGQDAARTAKSFDDTLGISGSILTKLDGDARGGAALSVKEITGQPIKFLGVGETLDKLEEFRPEGLADRILGFGDIVGLVQDFEGLVDEKKAEEDAKKILSGNFTLTTFLEQIRTIKKMGSLKDIFEKMPFFKDNLQGADMDDRQLVKVEAMILSMTRAERTKPELLQQQGRLNRIAKGSGTTLKDVRDLLNRYHGMRKMMKQVGQQPGLMGSLPGFKQLNMLRKVKGAQMDGLFDGMEDMGFADLAPKKKGIDTGVKRSLDREVMSARIDAKKKRRSQGKKAAKARKKNKKR